MGKVVHSMWFRFMEPFCRLVCKGSGNDVGEGNHVSVFGAWTSMAWIYLPPLPPPFLQHVLQHVQEF